MTNDAEVPAFRYTAALANDIEARWQDRWRRDGTFHAPNPTGALAEPDHPRSGAAEDVRARHVPLPVRGRPARRSPAGLHRHRLVRPVPADASAATCCTPWGSTRSVCRPSSTRSRPAPIRGRRPRRTSRSTGASCAASAWATTSGVRWRPPTSRSTGGPSGSSCSCSTPGTTRTPIAPARSRAWSRRSPTARRCRPTAATGPT